MKQVAQNYKSGELIVLDAPVPACRPGGVLLQTLFSLISTGTEMMKVHEASLSMVGKARARPDQVRKVLDTVAQQGAMATYKKVMNKLDSYTPLGYSLCGVVVEVGAGAEEFKVGQLVAAAGNEGRTQIPYPARSPDVVAVGATTEHGCLANYSNDGSGLTLVAPGGGADADLPGDPNCHPELPSGRDVFQMTFTGSSPRRFGFPSGYEGTSMASPHVGGPEDSSLYGAGLVNAGAATAPGGPGAVAK